MMRLGAMFGLLVIIVMLIARTREPEMWRWFVRQEDEGRIEHVGDPVEAAKANPSENAAKSGAAPVSAAQPAEAPPAAKPEQPAGSPAAPVAGADVPAASEEESEAEGPTDEDPYEWESAVEEFQAILDDQLYIRPEEMVPYKRVLGWVYNQSAETLLKRAKTGVPFDDFVSRPDKYRGKIFALNLTVKLCRRLPEGIDDLTLYEAWGMTRQSKTFLYDGILLDLPEGFPISDSLEISERATLVGYFFKVQSYQPAKAKPGQRPERAPMFIGRLIWQPAPPADVASKKTDWFMGISLGCVGGVILLIGWLFTRMGRVRSPSEAIMAASRGPGSIPVGDWLENREEEEYTPDEGGGNNSPLHRELTDDDAPESGPDEERHLQNGLDEGRS